MMRIPNTLLSNREKEGFQSPRLRALARKEEEDCDYCKFNPLYKYTRSEFVADMFCNGTVKMGTMYEFARCELTDPRRDPGEGLFSAIGENIDTRYDEDGEEMAKVTGSYGTAEHLSKSWIRHPDRYIFCMSTILSKKVMDRFGCDTCVRIDDPLAFVDELSIAMIRKRMTMELEPAVMGVSYCPAGIGGEPVVDMRSYHMLTPWICKSSSYAVEREFRAAWFPASWKPTVFPQPIDSSLEHLIIDAPGIAQYLSLVVPPEDS